MGAGRVSHATTADRVGRAREPHIETLRGLACVLLVSVHVVGDADEGLRLSEGHILSRLIWAFQPLRMPLFAFISGLLFEPSAANGRSVKSKLLDKAHRLLVPLASVGTVFFITRCAIRGTPLSDLWRVYFTDYDQFWYLTATFILMMTSVAALYFRPNARVGAAALCWVGGLGLYLLDLQLEPNWFSITKVFYLAPFFFLGQLFRATDFIKWISAHPRVVTASLAPIAALLTLRNSQLQAPVVQFGQQGFGMLLLSLALCTFLFATRWQSKWFAYVGPYSYAIFLFHLFFATGSRELIQWVDANQDPYLVFAFGMAAGLVGPMLAQDALLTRPWLAWALLGQRGARALDRHADTQAAARAGVATPLR